MSAKQRAAAPPARRTAPQMRPPVGGAGNSGAVLDMLSMFSGPDTSRPERGPYSEGYSYYNETEYGRSGGFGLQSGLIGDQDGWHASSDLLGYNGFQGERLESDGSTTYGEGHSVRVAGVNVGYGQRGEGAYGEFQADALGADAQAQFNAEQGANVGATAYLAQAALTTGDIGTDATDREARIGLAAGVGAAGRLHWADSDGDGNREYGFGADIGPLTFDVRSEDPVRDFVPGLDAAASLLGVDQGTNITNAVGRGIASAASATASFIGGIFSGW